MKLRLAIVLGMLLIPSGIVYAQVEPIREVFEPSGNFDPARYGKVAVVQWASTQPTPIGVSKKVAEEFKQRNREALEGYIREAAAKGAVWVVTPEFSVVGYPDIPELPPEEDEFRNREDIMPYVEPLQGESTRFFSKLAAELKVAIIYGFAEVDPKTDKYFNTVGVVSSTGRFVTSYRKINLYMGERNFLSAGTEAVTFQSPFGKVGLAICADIYSGKPMNDYKNSEVKAIALSTSWAHWNTGMEAFKSGARKLSAYVLAANQNYFPDSGVVNPDGTAQSHIRQTTGIAYGYLPYLKAKTAAAGR